MPGVLLAALETFLPARIARASRHRATAWFGLTLVAVAAVTTLYCGIWFQPFQLQSVPPLKGTLVFLLLTAVLGSPLLLQWWTGGCWRLLDNRVFRWVGQRSYSIYLVHALVLADSRRGSSGSRRQLLADVRRPAGGGHRRQRAAGRGCLPARRGALHEPEDLHQLAHVGAGGPVEAGSTLDSLAPAGGCWSSAAAGPFRPCAGAATSPPPSPPLRRSCPARRLPCPTPSP